VHSAFNNKARKVANSGTFIRGAGVTFC
jgi:hypothetical protein